MIVCDLFLNCKFSINNPVFMINNNNNHNCVCQ